MNIPIILKELAKVGVVALTEESVKSFVESKIKPIFANWGKEESRTIELEECLSEYLFRCYAKNNIMTTIVFGRVQKTLEDLYIPLTLEEYKCEKDKSEKDEWVINETCYDILDSYSRILIVDMAGMGKSTLVKYFACQGVNLDKCVPIVIELRRLEKNQSILEYIQIQINSLDKNIKMEEIVDILRKGEFVIFFDGYDEIANGNKSDVLDAIQEFTDKAANTKIVITSREEDDLNSLGEYKCVNIKPLTEEEAYELIKKYDNDGDISKKLIKRLEEDPSMKVLNEFLKNPLLVSLLYRTFEYKEEIPYKKIDFYEQVYAALFNDHDKTKGSAYVHEKKTKLDKYQFEQILRTFGFLSLKTEKVEYSEQLIYQLLEQSIKRFSWLKINVDDFLHDITHAVPFIQKDGNEYKWVHKSFMEYFASCFICYDNKEHEEKYFEKMLYNNLSTRYYNVLDFCYDMDTLGFRKYAILPLVKNYIKEYDSYFQNVFFGDFDDEYLCVAKGILSMHMNVIALKFSKTDLKKLECGQDIIEGIRKYLEISNLNINTKRKHISIHRTIKSNIAILFEINFIYRIMYKKMPDIFERLNMKRHLETNVDSTVYFEINDDVNNMMNQNINLFYEVINLIMHSLSDYCGILNYDMCKKLVEDIELEMKISNNSIFEL